MTELVSVYREARSKKMEWADAGQAARILKEIRTTIEGSDFEKRLTELEERVAAGKNNGRGYGQPSYRGGP